MTKQHSNPNSGNPSGKGPSAPSLQDFQFTFNFPAGNNSFIEPDPSFAEKEKSESLSDSVQNFPEEFGRTYHAYKAGSYAFPNDTPELERLALQNDILMQLFEGRLFFAPLQKSNPPRHILDIATGTGDWAIQMGDLFPSSEVTATDLSPIQPAEVPPNVNFYVEDSTEPWEYTQKFDYIHTRATSGCWSSFEKEIAQQAFDALEPGGYFESQEYDSSMGCDDGTLDPTGPLVRWLSDLTIAAERCDRPTVTGAIMKEAYEKVGFVDVQQIMFKIPTNGWPKDEHLKQIGKLWQENLMSGLSGFSLMYFHRAFGRSPAEIEVSLVDVRREISDPHVHAWVPFYVVWGRKPYPGETRG